MTKLTENSISPIKKKVNFYFAFFMLNSSTLPSQGVDGVFITIFNAGAVCVPKHAWGELTRSDRTYPKVWPTADKSSKPRYRLTAACSSMVIRSDAAVKVGSIFSHIVMKGETVAKKSPHFPWPCFFGFSPIKRHIALLIVSQRGYISILLLFWYSRLGVLYLV